MNYLTRHIAVAVFFLSSIAAVAQPVAVPAPPVAAPAAAAAPAPGAVATKDVVAGGDYRLGPGDAIGVQVYQSPDLSVDARVSESGKGGSTSKLKLKSIPVPTEFEGPLRKKAGLGTTFA